MISHSERARHLFTSESVTAGHPDKVADAISDSILDSLIVHDPKVRCASETLVTTGLIVLSGEVTVHNAKAADALAKVDQTARETVKSIGYDDPATGFDYRSCAVVRTLHAQSVDINQGVDRGKASQQGAGDQGMMFGFACDETSMLMPMPVFLAHRLTERLAEARQSGEVPWLRPDGKSQVTIEYTNNTPVRVHTVVVSTQHTEQAISPRTGNMSRKAKQEIVNKIIKPVVMNQCPALWNNNTVYHVNPTGRFVIGGPHGDTGLTGRKIIVDTYGGRGCHGGGAFSGKDPSKVDRSASYMARHIAKNVVKAGLARACEIQPSACPTPSAYWWTPTTPPPPTIMSSKRRSATSSRSGRPRSSSTSTCFVRSTARPWPTGISAGRERLSPGKRPTVRQHCGEPARYRAHGALDAVL